MRSVFEIGFHNNFHGPALGQWDIVAAALPSLIQGGVAVWGGLEQQKIAKIQKKAAEVQAQQQQQQQAAQEAKAKTQAGQPPGRPGAAGGLGIPSDVLVVGGVGLALVLGAVVVIVATRGGAAPAAHVA